MHRSEVSKDLTFESRTETVTTKMTAPFKTGKGNMIQVQLVSKNRYRVIPVGDTPHKKRTLEIIVGDLDGAVEDTGVSRNFWGDIFDVIGPVLPVIVSSL
jgi:hypothetical protein